MEMVLDIDFKVFQGKLIHFVTVAVMLIVLKLVGHSMIEKVMKCWLCLLKCPHFLMGAMSFSPPPGPPIGELPMLPILA